MKYINNKTKAGEAPEMLLYGEIGAKIDGDLFASELKRLTLENEEVTIRINSVGGNVFQGLSIVAVMHASTAKITAIVEGMAASMAGVIAMCAQEVKSNDFARIMVHNPGFTNSRTLTPKQKTAISHIKDMLIHNLTIRGFDKKRMDELLAAETWIKAEDALEMGLIDEVITTSKRAEVEALIKNSASLPSAFENIIHEKQNDFDMKLVTNTLGLRENTSEEQIANSIKELQNDLSKATDKVTNLTKANEALKKAQETEKKKAIETKVQNAIDAGKFTKEAKNGLITTGLNDEEALDSIIENTAANSEAESLIETVENKRKEKPESEKKDFEYYRKNPDEMEELKNESPEVFNKLYKAWNAKYGD